MKLSKIHIDAIKQTDKWLYYESNTISIGYCCKPDNSHSYSKYGRYLFWCSYRDISVSSNSEFKKDITYALKNAL